MSLPLESGSPSLEPVSGDRASTAFMTLLGAIAGGSPQLILPTATMIELIGNTLMGALLVGTLDAILLRRTLPGYQLRKGRVLLLVAISVTLTLVTYRTPGIVFQNVFNTSPPMGVRNLSAAAYTRERIGNVGYRLSFESEAVVIQQIQERMGKMGEGEARKSGDDAATYVEYSPESDWATFVKQNLPPGTPFLDQAMKFTEPQGVRWTSPTPNGRTATTVLLRDRKTGRTFVEHISG